MTLTDDDFAGVIAFRHRLHAQPEISGEERETARAVVAALAHAVPDQIVTGLGGHGVAAIFNGGTPGPSVLLRAELDGLPIEDLGVVPYRSTIAGRGHLCGHDGHMATLVATALEFGRRRPVRGRVILVFQPAEETGAGARAVVADPRFAPLKPDMSLSYHNMPGLPLGHAWLDAGPVNCASRGMTIALTGRTSHAAEPENGVSPLAAMASLLPSLSALRSGERLRNDLAMATVTHARLGEPAFGITPGHGEIFTTLRTSTDDGMAALVERAEALARDAARREGLGVAISYRDVFAHVENSPDAVATLRRALDAVGVPHERGDLPFKASEDFGIFGQIAPAAMVFLGAGEARPRLHNPDYDFPDDLIPIAARVLVCAARDLVG